LSFPHLTMRQVGAHAIVRVRVGAGVVAVHVAEAGVGRVVVVAAAPGDPRRHQVTCSLIQAGFWLFTVFSHPPSIRPISTIIPDQTSYLCVGRNFSVWDRRM